MFIYAQLGLFGTPQVPTMLTLIMYFTKLYLNLCINLSTLEGGAGENAKCCFCKNVIGESMYFHLRALSTIFPRLYSSSYEPYQSEALLLLALTTQTVQNIALIHPKTMMITHCNVV